MDARVKVLHIITRLDLGGAQSNTLYTARHLDPERFDCVLAAGPGGVLDAEAISQAPPRTVLIPELVREVSPVRDLAALRRLTRLCREEGPDVVHTHSSKAGVLGRLAARLAGVRAVVHTYHGFGFHDFMPAPLRFLYSQLERAACKLAHRTVFVSRANVDYALRHGLVEPGAEVLIRSGIKLSDYPARADKAAALSAAGLGGKSRLVVSIGNLKPQKNPEAFLSLAQVLAPEFPDTGFLFVGEGPLRGRLEAAVAASGLAGTVSLPGWRRDAAVLLAAADVFVLTSLWEGLPRALLEAMATGLPCVCNATDGVTDVLKDGENGFLADPRDPASLASKVRRVLDDPALGRRLGEAARGSLSAEFDIDHMVRQQEELYMELLRGRSR
ncbi:MAG: glycosyltransferase family 4 protein [Elusimicrobia bacterium]|nr:glycosyltransferase family 4 protein [Elusimicrobiota bacterium]